MQREAELKSDSNEMICKFNKIRTGLHSFIVDTAVNINNLKWILQDFKHCGTIRKTSNSEDVTENYMNVSELFTVISNYSSFFNYNLVEDIIKILKYEEGKILMEKYKQDFADYVKRRVTDCPSGIGMKGTKHVCIQVQLDESFADCRLEHILTLGKDICKILGIKFYKLQVEGAKPGSVCIVFHLVAEDVFPLSEKQLHEFETLRYMKAKILSISCGSYIYEIHLHGK